MAIFIRMEQRKNSKNSSYGKYYTKTVPMGEVTSEDIAKSLEKRSVFRAGLVEDVLYEISKELKTQLQQGMIVSLKGIGRFQLVVASEGNDHPEDFDIANDITRVDCKFLPEGHRNPFDSTITRTLTEGVKAKWAPPYDRE